MKSRFSTLLLLLFTLFALALAVAPPQKHVVVSYPDNTPDHVLEAAKSAIKKAGGIITHDFNLIKGFAAKATEEALETVGTMGKKYHALIEIDQVVSVDS